MLAVIIGLFAYSIMVVSLFALACAMLQTICTEEDESAFGTTHRSVQRSDGLNLHAQCAHTNTRKLASNKAGSALMR